MASINEYREEVPRFAPDPRGASYVGALGRFVQSARGVTGGGVYSGAKGDGSNGTTFEGDFGRNLQLFTGAAALALAGAVKNPNTAGDTADALARQAQANLTDPALRIFAARAARQQGD